MLIGAVILVGVGVVIPLALGHPVRWLVAALAAATSLTLSPGGAAASLAAVWLLVAVWVAAQLLVELRPWRPAHLLRRPPEVWASWAATGFAVVAAVAFVGSRAGLELFGIGEPIVALTAVHFTYAGVGAVTLAGAAVMAHPRAGLVAVAMTVAAPPVVATGFLVQHPVPQVGGAVLMSAGVMCTAALQLVEAGSCRTRRWLLLVSGLAPWIPMVLAVAWAASLYWSVPALSIPDMARTHGVMNVVFVLAGLCARRPRPERAERTALVGEAKVA